MHRLAKEKIFEIFIFCVLSQSLHSFNDRKCVCVSKNMHEEGVTENECFE